jgi:hypothetical protein
MQIKNPELIGVSKRVLLVFPDQTKSHQKDLALTHPK